MSASSEAVSGAHSGGLATTVLPAARAGPMRQVASISGAFHGVMIAVTPAGSQVMCSRWPRISRSGWDRVRSMSAKKRKFIPTRGITLRRWDRSSAPLSRVSTTASSSARLSMPSAIRCRMSARSSRGSAAQPGNACWAAATARSTSAAPPAATSASGCSSMGEMSVKVRAEATRCAADPVPGIDRDALHHCRVSHVPRPPSQPAPSQPLPCAGPSQPGCRAAACRRPTPRRPAGSSRR